MTEKRMPRMASIKELKPLLEAHLAPVPHIETLRDWFTQARIPKFKINRAAKRGGGVCFYSVSHVEKLLQGMSR